MSKSTAFIERAAGLKAAAQERRNRGLHTGASAKGWNWKPQPLDPSDYYSHFIVARDEWQSAARNAINDFRAACLNGPGWDNDCEIPF